MLLGILAFVFMLLLSVMLHELGHFTTARLFGVKVTQFFVGFGPTLWSVKRGETEYGIKAIPAGGFVRIVGMSAEEQLAPEDEDRALYRQSTLRRLVVMSAGSMVHFVIGFFLLFLAYALIGDVVASTTVNTVSRCVTQTASPSSCQGKPQSPASRAGVQPGDQLLAIDGVPVKSWVVDLPRLLKTHPDGPLSITVDRAGKTRTLATTLEPGEPRTLGVRSRLLVTRRGWLNSASHALDSGATQLVSSVKGIISLPATTIKLLSSSPSKDPAQRPVGVVGAAAISGKVLGADAPLSVRVGEFFLLIASLNLFIGVFNLVPLLPLDGGHIAIALYESGRRRLFKLLGRPIPGRVSLQKLVPVTLVVMASFVLISVLVLVSDLSSPIPSPLGH